MLGNRPGESEDPCALQRCGNVLYGMRSLWEVLFGCPFSLMHHMNLRYNSTGQTADASHTTSTSYLSASESHRHCQPVTSCTMCVCVLLGLQRCSLTRHGINPEARGTPHHIISAQWLSPLSSFLGVLWGF